MIKVAPLCWGAMGVQCAPRPNLRIPSPWPRSGLEKRPGLIPVDFSGIIPREAEAPADSSWRRRVPRPPEEPETFRNGGGDRAGQRVSFQWILSKDALRISANSWRSRERRGTRPHTVLAKNALRTVRASSRPDPISIETRADGSGIDNGGFPPPVVPPPGVPPPGDPPAPPPPAGGGLMVWGLFGGMFRSIWSWARMGPRLG
jgi:hypothetical protein